MGALGAAVWWHASRHPPALSVHHLPFWSVLLLLYGSQQLSAPVTVGRQSVLLGFQTYAVITALLFTSPAAALTALLVTGALDDLWLNRRRLGNSLSKMLFNLANVALAAGVAALVIAAFDVRASPATGLRVWLATAIAVVAFEVVSALWLTVVLAIHGALDLRRINAFLLPLAASPPVNVLLALLTLAVVATNRWGLTLIAGLTLGLSLLRRMYSRLASRYDRLGVLYAFTQELAGLSEEREVLEAVLDGLLHALACERAELLVEAPVGVLRYAMRNGGSVTEELLPGWTPLGRLALDTAGLLLAKGSGAVALAGTGLREAIAQSREISGRRVVLVVGDRLDSASSLEQADVDVMEALSAHAAVALRGSRLLGELRLEVASREREALHDGLTSLGNRTMLVQRTEVALHDRPTDALVALVLLDLDGFKEINDTLGHDVGDEVLRQIGRRLEAALSAIGVPTRLGGDEFAILFPRVRSTDEARALAHSVAEVVAQPVKLGQLALSVRASVGVALGPTDGRDTSQLLKRADVAMYAAKGSGGGVVLYDPTRDGHTTRRLLLAGELRDALGTPALRAHYQPKVAIDSGRIVGFEALLRWDHPVYGPVSPLEFIPVAEQSGMIDALTWWMLDAALHQQQLWAAEGHDLAVSVNISPRSLLDASMAGQLSELLGASGVDPQHLVLEVTETSVMADGERAAAVLQEISELGVRIAIDDFGTGYSSLSRLRELPVHEIKIDRSFVESMLQSTDNRAIVASTVDLALSLGREVTAEGIEDQPTWDALRAMGCQYGQGYLIAPALPADAVLPWLQAGTVLLSAFLAPPEAC